MSAKVDCNCKIVPLLATEREPIHQPADTHEDRVAKIRAEVSEIMRKAGKSAPPKPLELLRPSMGANARKTLVAGERLSMAVATLAPPNRSTRPVPSD